MKNVRAKLTMLCEAVALEDTEGQIQLVIDLAATAFEILERNAAANERIADILERIEAKRGN